MQVLHLVTAIDTCAYTHVCTYSNIYGGQIFDILYEKEVAEDMLLSPTDDESEKISTEALRAFVCLFGATGQYNYQLAAEQQINGIEHE